SGSARGPFHLVGAANCLAANLASSSLARIQPADSSITTEMVGATIWPRKGTNLESSLVSVLIGCLSMLFLMAVTARVLAASSVRLPLNTAHRAMVIEVMVTMSAATPRPGTGTALPAATAAAWVWMMAWHFF